MTNDETREPAGYHVGPDARVVLHRHASRGTYAVAVVLDEGPFSADEARRMAEELREAFGRWVSKAEAARRLGVSARQVDTLRASGVLESVSDETGHALIGLESLAAELLRRAA
jgi:hypothetical protein